MRRLLRVFGADESGSCDYPHAARETFPDHLLDRPGVICDIGRMQWTFILGVAVLVYLAVSIRVLRQYERGVVFLLGRFEGIRGPGLTLIFVPFQQICLLYTSPSPRDGLLSRMPSSA